MLHLDIQRSHVAIVIASDGVWEFLNNKKVTDLMTQHLRQLNTKKAVDAVVNESVKMWK